MNYKNFSKALLNIYNSLDAVCDRLDRMVETKAVSGALDFSGRVNPMDLFNSIIDLSERKVNLINLKIRIENAFVKLKEKEAKVLILKYVDGLTFNQIANLTNQSLRNCFRVCENAIENFGKILKLDGLTEEKIQESYSDEKWIFQICDFEEFESRKNSKREVLTNRSPYISKRDIAKIASKSVLSL